MIMHKTMQIASNRDLSIDIAKGIGIILVYFAHAVNNCYPKEIIGAFHMPLFFFLSGLLYNPVKYSYSQFFIRRVKSLIVPLLSFTLIGLAIGLSLGVYDLRLLSYDFLPAHWFLFVLFAAEIVSFYPGRLSKAELVLSIIALVFIGMYLAPHLPSSHSVNSVFHASAFYLLGFVYSTHRNKIEPENKLRLCVIGLCMITFVAIYVYFVGSHLDIKSNIVDWGGYLTAIVGTLGTLFLSKSMAAYQFCSKVLCYFGRISLTIMGFHLIFFHVFIHYKDIFPSTIVYALAKFTLPMILCCGIAWVFEQKHFKFLLGKF